jgi:hypothetical protein
MPYRCESCGRPWKDKDAADNEYRCVAKCGGMLRRHEAVDVPAEWSDLRQVPYPLALTARRLAAAITADEDILRTLFLLKDCFEASVKYVAVLLLTAYLRGPANQEQRQQLLLRGLVHPLLGIWVNTVISTLKSWLQDDGAAIVKQVISLLDRPASPPAAAESTVFERCQKFVEFRNDALGHGAARSDDEYATARTEWLPLIKDLLIGIEKMGAWQLCLVKSESNCQVWMGPEPGGELIESGRFLPEHVGHFVLRGPDAGRSIEAPVADLWPFLCYLPPGQEDSRLLQFYDSVHRFKTNRKEMVLLDYDTGHKHVRAEPMGALEVQFTPELLAIAMERYHTHVAEVDKRVERFDLLIEEHARIVGRKKIIDKIRALVSRGERDRGVVVIQGSPGTGKTALLCHLIEEIFHDRATAVHFFYRRTAGITDPDACLQSLYYALLRAHNLKEPSKTEEQMTPEAVATALSNLLKDHIAPRLADGRPQLIFIDALDEAGTTAAGRSAYQCLPENLPDNVFVIATTRTIDDRVVLARRNASWLSLDDPDLFQDNLNDGREYVRRELGTSGAAEETIEEVARVGAGNFLVLKLVCRHIRTSLTPDEVPDFLRGLATDEGMADGKERLGFIYAEFWQRLMNRLPQVERNLLADIAGILVHAYGPVTEQIICSTLGCRAIDWDFARRHLIEYLNVVRIEEDGYEESFYRIYHETFAEFLRNKLTVDRPSFCNLLADYCAKAWQEAEGYGRRYALRNAPRHLRDAGRVDDAAALLTDFAFTVTRIGEIGVEDIVLDYSICQSASADANQVLAIWKTFLLERSHLLHRGDDDWPPNRIFLQLALEHADDSPLTVAAERWLASGECDWPCLRRQDRPRSLNLRRGASASPRSLVVDNAISAAWDNERVLIIGTNTESLEVDVSGELHIKSRRFLASFEPNEAEHEIWKFGRTIDGADDHDDTVLLAGQFRWKHSREWDFSRRIDVWSYRGEFYMAWGEDEPSTYRRTVVSPARDAIVLVSSDGGHKVLRVRSGAGDLESAEVRLDKGAEVVALSSGGHCLVYADEGALHISKISWDDRTVAEQVHTYAIGRWWQIEDDPTCALIETSDGGVCSLQCTAGSAFVDPLCINFQTICFGDPTWIDLIDCEVTHCHANTSGIACLIVSHRFTQVLCWEAWGQEQWHRIEQPDDLSYFLQDCYVGEDGNAYVQLYWPGGEAPKDWVEWMRITPESLREDLDVEPLVDRHNRAIERRWPETYLPWQSRDGCLARWYGWTGMAWVATGLGSIGDVVAWALHPTDGWSPVAIRLASDPR